MAHFLRALFRVISMCLKALVLKCLNSFSSSLKTLGRACNYVFVWVDEVVLVDIKPIFDDLTN